MILTDNKIEVTHQMMEVNNMTKGNKYGIPINPNNPSSGLCWKSIIEINDNDFDLIEEYFIIKNK